MKRFAGPGYRRRLRPMRKAASTRQTGAACYALQKPLFVQTFLTA